MTAATTVAPIDAQTAYDLLAAAVELAGPDHVYEIPEGSTGCQYVDGDNPSCIVGVALAIHGVPLDVMREWDAGGSTSIDSVQLAPLGYESAGFLSRDAVKVFQAAQVVQDRVSLAQFDAFGVTWSAALEAAAAALAELR